MSQIRIPANAERLLPFCRPWHHRTENTCFDSYAQMITFASGVGYSKLTGPRAPECKKFLDQPHPIDVEIFRNLQLFPVLLLLTIAVTGKHQSSRDDKLVCGLAENYAAVGFEHMIALLDGSSAEEFPIEVARMIVENTNLQKEDKI
jgi:hypothetical protein